MAKRLVSSQSIRGADDMNTMLYELNNSVSDNMRKGGYSGSQWVLGRLPRKADVSHMDIDKCADLGILSESF